MQKNNEMSKLSKTIAKEMASMLGTVLNVEANSTSCSIVYQPKAPKELSKFRRDK